MAEEEVGAATPKVLTAKGPPGHGRRGEECGSDGVRPIRRCTATPLLLLSILLPLLLLSGNALGQQPQRQNKQPAVAKKAARPGRAKTVSDLFNTSSCADPPYRCPYPRIEFYLYTRSTQEEPEKLDLLKDAGPSLMETHFDAAHPTKIVIHGFGGGRKLSPSPDMRKAYFTRGEFNVIIVDYSSLVVEPCLSQVEWGPRFCALCIAQLIGWLDDAWQWSIRSLVAANRVARQAPTASRWIDFDDRLEYDDGEEGAEPSADDGNFGQRVVQSIGRVVVKGRGRGGVSRGHGGNQRGGGVAWDGGGVPRGGGGVPRGEGDVPRGGGWVHRGEGGVPRGGDWVPRGEGEVPRGEGEVPRVGGGEVPRGEEGVPRGEGGVPRGEGGVPGGGGSARVVSDSVVTRIREGRGRGDGNGVTSANGLSDTRGGRGGVVTRVREGGARGDGVTIAADALDDAREGGAGRDTGDARGGEGGRWEVITETPRRLLRFVGSPPQGVHVIGYSVGAHIAGLLANYVGARKIGRITGLDPTIIFYMGNNRSRDLDPTDALFVDVIHTGAGVLGQWGPNGHVDFYVNGGTSQPGCTGGIYETLACDHQKVTPYFIESITSQKGFWATPCTNLLLYLIGWCTTTDESKLIKMGEDVPLSARGIYYLETNARRPYAKGLPSDSTRRKRRGRG